MWYAIQWLISYIIGGVSFTLLLAAAIFAYVWIYASTPIGDPDPDKALKGKMEHDALQEEMETGHPMDIEASVDGWLNIRRTYDRLETGINPLLNPRSVPEEPVVEDKAHQKPTYSSRFAQTYRSITGNTKKNDQPKDYFWCSLKGHVFYIHRLKEERVADWDEIKKRFPSRDNDAKRPSKDMLDTMVVLDLNRYKVTMEGRDENETITEGKLFGKRNAVCLRLLESEKGKKEGLPLLAKGMSSGAKLGLETGEAFEDEGGPWYLFSKSNCKAEDWYINLLKQSRAKPSTSHVWSEEHMSWFKDKMHTEDEEDKSGLEWLNAIVGRIFLGITHTALVEQFIIDKLNKKLALVSHPLIGPLVATEVNLGHIPPTVSNAMLKQCDANGEVKFHAHLDYCQPKHIEGSSIRITIEATKLGFRAVLAVIVKAISGDVEVRIKGPPSDRLWWAFLTPPKMDISIEPILGSRTINWNIVLSFIEKKMREGINDSVVLPYMDDTPFFDTTNITPRGVIFNSASKRAYAKEKKERKERDEKEPVEDSDSKSIQSVDSKSDKEREKLDKIENKFDRPFDTQSVSSVRTHTEGMGMRKRGNKAAIPEGDLLETHAVQRSETTPNLGASKKPTSKPSSLRMFGSRPTSPRKKSGESDNRPKEVVDGNETKESKEPSDLEVLKVENPTHLHTTSVSIDETPRTQTPASDVSRDGADAHRLTTQSVLTAVRARDKAAIQSQVFVGREAVKKWGVNFMNKRREQHAPEHLEQPTPSSYYAPSPDDLDPSVANPGHHPRTSLQERLNAAALAAAAKKEDERHAATSLSSDLKPQAPPVPSRSSKPRSDSASSATMSPARAMVVPSVPRRPGVPTAIGNDIHTKSDPAPPATTSPVSATESSDNKDSHPPSPPAASPPMVRVESDPLGARPAERAEETDGDKAATPIPSVTAANVTTRMRQASNGSSSSPARESLLAASGVPTVIANESLSRSSSNASPVSTTSRQS